MESVSLSMALPHCSLSNRPEAFSTIDSTQEASLTPGDFGFISFLTLSALFARQDLDSECKIFAFRTWSLRIKKTSSPAVKFTYFFYRYLSLTSLCNLYLLDYIKDRKNCRNHYGSFLGLYNNLFKENKPLKSWAVVAE